MKYKMTRNDWKIRRLNERRNLRHKMFSKNNQIRSSF